MPGVIFFALMSHIKALSSFPLAVWECSVRRVAPIYKNNVSLSRRLLNRGPAPGGELLSFAPSRQLLLRRLKRLLLVLSIAVPDAILPRQPLPALLYLLRPCSRPPSLGAYLLHPCSRKESNQRKDGLDAACFLCSSLSSRVARRVILGPLATRCFLAAPLTG
jgi:hypothetical protein